MVEKKVRWRFVHCSSIFNDFDRFYYGKVILNSDFFEETLSYSF